MAAPVRAVVDPEQETLRISKLLKPVSDDDWKLIAGEKTGQDYQVVRGDTLWDVSKRLFGDPKYWPKVWALNNGRITNPHLITPGQSVTFLPGTGTSLPALGSGGDNGIPQPNGPLQVADNSGKPAAPQGPQGRSDEWKLLPRQDWEQVQLELPPEVDPNGFDTHAKIIHHKSQGVTLESFPASQKIPYLGEIRASRHDGKYLTLGDTVFIEPKDGMQVGETYTITGDPYLLKSRKSDRAGYSYPVLGEVKVIAVREGLFVGTITTGKAFVQRGGLVIPRVPRVPPLEPIAGPRPIEGVLIMDRNFSTYTTSQYKLVYVDRGADDGVKPGMVFRAYQHRDPSNDSNLTGADFIIDGDFMVLQTSETFSVALAIRTLVPVYENETVVLLTDVSDLLKKGGLQERDLEQKKLDDELDNLDKLDSSGGLGPNEERELKQLEQWKGNPPDSTAPQIQESVPTEGTPPQPETVPPPNGGGTDQDLFGPPPTGGEAPPPPAGEGAPPPDSGSAGQPGPETAPFPPSGGDTPPPPPPPPPPSTGAPSGAPTEEPGVEPLDQGQSVSDPFESGGGK
jgi:nucleoid-associated protein YgaU